MKRLCGVILFLFAATQAQADSGLRYGYYQMTTNYEYYTGLRSNNVKLNVHDFQLSDASGEFSAALQTTGNRMSAEAGAINEENRKIEKGESAGGPKTLNYQYEKAEAKSGDSKVFGLRLGSTDNPFGSEAMFGNEKKDGLITYAELSISTGITGGSLYQSDAFTLGWSSAIAFHFGGIKQTETDAVGQKNRFRDAAIGYIPLTGKLILGLPIPLQLTLESGLDPITLYRQKADNTDIPLDIFHSMIAEYRFGVFGIGLQYERYSGSIITGKREAVKHPVYNHEMLGAYVVLGM